MSNVCKTAGRKTSPLIEVIPLLEITKEITVISANLMLPEADLGLLQHPRWSFQPLTIITKSSTLDVEAVLDRPLVVEILWKRTV